MPTELPGTRGSRGTPEGPAFAGRLQAGACHCGLTLQPAAQGRGRAGMHSSGWICKERRTSGAHGSAGSVLVLRSQRWRGCSQVGLRGNQEGQESRTPLPSPSLEIAWLPPRAFLAGVVDQPCALMYVCVKPYVTSHWFFALGFIFGLFFLFKL